MHMDIAGGYARQFQPLAERFEQFQTPCIVSAGQKFHAYP